MARPSSGAWTVYESLRIELSFLLKGGYIKKGCIVSSQLTWTEQYGKETGSIAFRSSYLGTPQSNFIELSYALSGNGDKLDRNYKVYLHEQPSNLGKGVVLYFLCPQSGRKCRILYNAYGSDYFKARQSYRHRLYYDCQMASQLSKYNDNFWRINRHLEHIKKQSCYGRRTYKRLLTKKAVRYNCLSLKRQRMDELRWILGAPKCLRSMLSEKD